MKTSFQFLIAVSVLATSAVGLRGQTPATPPSVSSSQSAATVAPNPLAPVRPVVPADVAAKVAAAINAVNAVQSLDANVTVSAGNTAAPIAVSAGSGYPHVVIAINSDGSTTVQGFLTRFEVQREQVVETRAALVERLAGATTEQRQAILGELRTEQQTRIDEQRAMAKTIRDELKKLRDTRKNTD